MGREALRLAMEELLLEVDVGHPDPVRLRSLITQAGDAVLKRYLDLSKNDDRDERRELGIAAREIVKLQTEKLG